MAAGRTVQGWVNLYRNHKLWRHRRPEIARAGYYRLYKRSVALYGADPKKNMIARFKWLEARSEAQVRSGLLSLPKEETEETQNKRRGAGNPPGRGTRTGHRENEKTRRGQNGKEVAK